MKPSLTDTLCTRCGLCCDGSLFADVELAGPLEAAGLEAFGLEIEDDEADGELLVQPCAALLSSEQMAAAVISVFLIWFFIWWFTGFW